MPPTDAACFSLSMPPGMVDPHFPCDAAALIVEPSLDELVQQVAILTALGFRVTAAESFSLAKAILSAQPPVLLVAALHLHDYNGLHLVLRGKSVQPAMAALITSTVADPVLHADAEALGATFVLRPISEPEFAAAISRTMARRDAAGPPIRPPFERRAGDRRGALLPFNAERRGSDRRQTVPSPSALATTDEGVLR